MTKIDPKQKCIIKARPEIQKSNKAQKSGQNRSKGTKAQTKQDKLKQKRDLKSPIMFKSKSRSNWLKMHQTWPK